MLFNLSFLLYQKEKAAAPFGGNKKPPHDFVSCGSLENLIIDILLFVSPS